MRTRDLGLPLLERRLLILADGTRTLAQLQEMFNIPVLEFAVKLRSMGLLEDAPQNVAPVAVAVAAAAQAAIASRATARTQPAPLAYDAYDAGGNVDADADAALAEDLASDFAEERSSMWTNSSGRDSSHSEVPDDTVPGMLMHRAASQSGIAAGKSFLIATSQAMLGANAAVLIRKITAAHTEADLYFALELLVTAVSVRVSSSEVNAIILGFERKISLR